MTLSIMGLVATLSIKDTQHNSIKCHYAECRDYLNVVLNVGMLCVFRLNVVMLSFGFVAPFLAVEITRTVLTILHSLHILRRDLLT
jgi:hypothetical protein